MVRPEGQTMTDHDVAVATPSNDDSQERPDRSIAEQLVDQARADGVDLVGPGGLLSNLTKQVLETGLEVEMEEHLGYEKYAAEGRNGENSRNGTRSKTVITEVGPVDLDVPHDRDGSFEPKTVKKRQRRLDGVDSMVISLTAKGLTTGEVEAHLMEVYSTEISRETISKITDRVLDEMADWQNRPLDRVYPVIFIDALVVKIRDGRVREPARLRGDRRHRRRRTRDILGLWVGTGGEGAKYWLQVLTEIKNRGVEDSVHGRVRRAQRPARINRSDLAVGDCADLRAAPDPQHLPPRRPRRLGQDGKGSAAGLHRSQRSRRRWPARRVPHHLGNQVSGDQGPVVVGVGRVRAVLGLLA